MTLGHILAIISLLFTTVFFIYGQFIRHLETRIAIIKWLRRNDWLSRYQKVLTTLLNWAQRFYGRADSCQAFDRSLLIAAVYPIFFFVVAYGFFDGGYEFYGVALLPEQSDYPWLYVFLLTAIAVTTTLLFIKEPEIICFIKTNISNNNIVINLCYFASFIIIVFASVVVSTASAIFASVAFVVGIGIALTSAVFIISVLGVAAVLGIGNIENYISSFFFLLLLPLINALFDWVSLWASRYFLTKASTETKSRHIIFDSIYDVGLAIVFMLLLALVLPGLVELFNMGLAWFDLAVIDWRSMAAIALDDPWGKGIMLTMLVITTLVPTIIHIILGSLSLGFNSHIRNKLADYLERSGETEERISSFWGALLLCSYCVLVLILFLAPFYFIFSIILDIEFTRYFRYLIDYFFGLK